MLSKEQVVDLTEILAVGAVTAAGFLVGGVIGPSVISGIGINLASNIINGGSSNLKEQWLKNKKGILNHDIQHALLRAYIKALASIEEKYFKLYDKLPKNEQETKGAIRAFFKDLTERAEVSFLPSIERAIDQREVKEYLYSNQELASNLLWDRICAERLLHNYNQHFIDFLRDNLLNVVQFYFAEELKADNRECNKAWRAFQRMLLEGIQGDVKDLKVNQEQIQADSRILDEIKEQLDRIQDTVDHRVMNEPFQSGLEKTIVELKDVFLESLNQVEIKVDKIDDTTSRTEKKLDAVVADVKMLLGSDNESQYPELNSEIKPLLDELNKFIKENRFNEAEELFKGAIIIADSQNDEYSRACINRLYARIVKEKYFDVEKENAILTDCLHVFEKFKATRDVATTKEHLSQIRAAKGDFESAEIYANDFLTYAKAKNDFYEIGSAYVTLGVIELEKHQYVKAIQYWDESIQYGTRLVQSEEKDKRENGIYLTAIGNHNKSIAFKGLGKLDEAKSACLKTLPEYRQLGKKEELGKTLFELAELECFLGNIKTGKWNEYIDEAKIIFRELRNYSWVSRCIDLIARIAYTSGQKELALEFFKEGYEEIKKSNDREGICYYIEHFASFYIDQKDYVKAETYLKELIEYAETNKLSKSIIQAYEDLARISDKQGNTYLRDKYYKYIIKEYQKENDTEQSPIKRAMNLAQIGDAYTRRGDLREALYVFEKVATIFQELNELGGYAKSTLIVAELNMRLRNTNKAYDNWLKVEEAVKGTPFYEFASTAKINIGSSLIRTGDYEAAQRYLEEAKYLVSKYMFKHLEDTVDYLLIEVKTRMDITNPPERSFHHIINRLYEGINNTKEALEIGKELKGREKEFKIINKKKALEPLLRHWYSKYDKDLYKHYYSQTGLKAIIYSSKLETAQEISTRWSWLFGYFLVVSKEEFPKGGHDFMIYPYEIIEKGENILTRNPDAVTQVNESAKSLEDRLIQSLNNPSSNIEHKQYYLSPVKFDDEVKWVLFGWGMGLPKIAYDFIRNNTAAEVISGNTFILNLERYEIKDKLYSDVLYCWQLGFIPLYINEELKSESVRILGRIRINLPFEEIPNISKIISTKKLINSLFKIEKDNARVFLNDFGLDVESLFASDKELVQVTVSLAEVKYGDRNLIHPILSLNLKHN
jgi:tetratricopeptide (TPR) repeat protein